MHALCMHACMLADWLRLSSAEIEERAAAYVKNSSPDPDPHEVNPSVAFIYRAAAAAASLFSPTILTPSFLIHSGILRVAGTVTLLLTGFLIGVANSI